MSNNLYFLKNFLYLQCRGAKSNDPTTPRNQNKHNSVKLSNNCSHCLSPLIKKSHCSEDKSLKPASRYLSLLNPKSLAEKTRLGFALTFPALQSLKKLFSLTTHLTFIKNITQISPPLTIFACKLHALLLEINQICLYQTCLENLVLFHNPS